jgi:cysteine-S-conjugate beta-lyase
MKYNFDEVLHREGTGCIKYDARKAYFGTDKVIPMWVADMDFRSPGFVSEAIIKRSEHEIFGYFQKPESYYQSIVDWMASRHNWKIQKEWILFAPGVVPAVNMAVLAYTQPGDKIIIQPPVYFPFFTAIKNHNRQISYNPLREKDGYYTMDYEQLESIIDEKTKMLILCSPHNPVGRVWKREELMILSEICLKNNIIILSDEIHADLTYRGFKHIPTAGLSELIAGRTVTFTAPSKTFNLAGLAASNLIIPDKNLREQYSRYIDNLHLAGGNIFGVLTTEIAYKLGLDWLNQLMDYLEINLDFLTEFIQAKLPKIKLIRPEATYLVWLDFRDLGLSQAELKEFLIKKAELGLNDGTTFGSGGEGYMRINIACRKTLLTEALEKLHKAYISL